jgi:TolA-binding protein
MWVSTAAFHVTLGCICRRLLIMQRRYTIAVLLTLLLSGCGSGSFVGKRFENFTAYYNKFYNARKAFEKGYKSIQKTDDPIDRDRYLPLFVRPSGNSTIRDFDSAIKKSADVLRQHPDSKWVDDALLLIGKSYFYQEAFVGALQKFREVVDLNTDLVNEGRFWLARTLITSGALDDAFAELQQSLAREDVPDKWMAMFQLALGELHVVRSEWLLASEALSAGVDRAEDKDIASRGRFLLGQVYETMGRYNDSAQAFREVLKNNPLYELSYAAQISAIRVEGMHSSSEQALKALRKMERDDKNYDNLAELTFLRARILQASGRADEAYNLYHDLLYDERQMSNVGTLKGRIHYALGELYRDVDKDYVMAAAHFDTAAVNLRRPPSSGSSSRVATADQYSSAAIVDIDDLKTSFSGLASVSKDVARMDSLLWLGRMPQEDFDAKILELRFERAAKLEAQRKLREERKKEQQFQQSTSGNDPFLNRGLPPGKVIPTKGDPSGRASGFLFHRDPARSQDGQSNFKLKWGDRPLAPNWRRRSAISGGGRQDLVSETDEDSEESTSEAGTLPEIDVSSVPRDSVSQARMESLLAIARYELGNRLFLSLNRPDSAAVWYRHIVEEDSTEPVARRALYALAEVQKALGDSISAERIYDRIIEENPDSDFARRILIQRGEADETAGTDSVAIADRAYEGVIQQAEEDTTGVSIALLLEVAAAFPGMDVRARALLAGGRVHMRVARADTVVLFEPIDLAVSDTVLASIWPDKFPTHFLNPPLDEAGPVMNPDSVLVPEEGVGPDSSLVSTPSDSLSARVDSVDVSTDLQGVLSDSPGSSTVSLSPPDSSSTVSLSPPDSSSTVTEESVFERPSIVIQDFFSRVIKEFPGTPYSSLAEETLAAIEDLRIPEVDSTEALVESDSLSSLTSGLDSTRTSLVADSLLAVQAKDSLATGVVKDSTGVEAGIRNGQLASQSETSVADTTLSRVSPAAPADSSNVVADNPIFALKKALADSAAAARAGGVRDFSDPGAPARPLPSQDAEDQPSKDEGGDSEEMDVMESSVLRPLLSTGLPDSKATGWSVIMQWARNIGAAQIARKRYEIQLDSTGVDVMVVVGMEAGRRDYLVTWGLFETRAEMLSAIETSRALLPEELFYLHMLPGSRRP